MRVADARRAVALAVALLAMAQLEASAAGRLKVLHATGRVEVRSAGGGPWKPLAKGDPVILPAMVRTAPGAEAIVLMDWRLRAAVRLPSGSQVRLETPVDLVLESGQAWVLVDEPLTNHPEMRVRSGRMALRAPVGSFVVRDPKAPSVEVYNDTATVSLSGGSSTEVPEGYRLDASGQVRRLQYADYSAWREYANAYTRLKDDWAVRQLEEEYSS